MGGHGNSGNKTPLAALPLAGWNTHFLATAAPQLVPVPPPTRVVSCARPPPRRVSRARSIWASDGKSQPRCFRCVHFIQGQPFICGVDSLPITDHALLPAPRAQAHDPEEKNGRNESSAQGGPGLRKKSAELRPLLRSAKTATSHRTGSGDAEGATGSPGEFDFLFSSACATAAVSSLAFFFFFFSAC